MQFTQGKDAVRLVLLKDALVAEGKWVRGRGRSQRKEGGQRSYNHCWERRGKPGPGGDREERGKRTTGKTLEMEVTGLLGGLWQVARGSIRSDTQVSGFGGWVRAGAQDGEAGLWGEGRGQKDIWGISPPSGNKGGKGLGAELHTRLWDSQCY